MRPESISPNVYVPSFSIGGSDVGAIIGVNEHRDIMDVYARLLGLKEYQEVADNDAMERGRYLEPVAKFKYAQATGRTLTPFPEKVLHPEYPFLHVSPDMAIHSDHRPDPGILECKCPGDFVFDRWRDDGIDKSYYAQLQHGMFVTGYQWGAFAIFAGGKWKLWEWDVERDEPFIETMESACIDFWNNNVLKKVPPLKLETTPEFPRAALGGRTIYAKEPKWIEAMADLKKSKAEEKLAKYAKELAEKRLKEMMGEITHVTIPNVGKISWAESTRRNFDWKAMAAAHPEIEVEQYMNVTAIRTFLPTFSK